MIISHLKPKNSKCKLIQFIFGILKKSCDSKKYFLFFLIFKKIYLLSNKVSYIIFERNEMNVCQFNSLRPHEDIYVFCALSFKDLVVSSIGNIKIIHVSHKIEIP